MRRSLEEANLFIAIPSIATIRDKTTFVESDVPKTDDIFFGGGGPECLVGSGLSGFRFPKLMLCLVFRFFIRGLVDPLCWRTMSHFLHFAVSSSVDRKKYCQAPLVENTQ